MIHRLTGRLQKASMLQEELGNYSVGSSKPDRWHGQIDQIHVLKISLEGIWGKWIAEGMT